MASQTQIRANRTNPLKSGLFAKEFVFIDGEKAEFDALGRRVRAELQPTTVMQNIGVDGIVCCCWRCKLAMRREMQKLSALFDMANNQDIESEDATGPSTTAGGTRPDAESCVRHCAGSKA